MNVITNICTPERRQKEQIMRYAKKETANILPQWREKYEFPVIEFKHPHFMFR